MIIHSLNILVFPALLVVWILDIYVLTIGIRLILSRIPAAGGVCQGLRRFTDPIPDAIGSWLTAKFHKPVRAWIPWVLVGLASLLIRHMLILIVFSAH